jgi:small conductance mechanosensitive channel
MALVRQEVEWVTTAWESAISFVVTYSFQLLGALLVMAIGVLVANRVHRLALKVQERRNVDVTLRQFLAAVARIVVLIGFAIMAVGKIGLNIGPFLAAIGGLALGASFALQLPVSNYGAGLVIILTRPFRVGDTIRIIDQWGIVDDINLAMTHLTNEDGEEIIIPNKHLIGEVLINSRSNRIVEGVVQVSYGDDPEKAVEVVRSVLAADPDVADTPAFQAGIQAFADSGIEIGYRHWVPTRHYFEVQYRVNLAVWRAVSEAGLTIPFPQRDVHLVNAAAPPAS